MLMALLPLAGWAEDISWANVAVGNIVKGTEAPGAPFVVWKGETLIKGTHYTLQGYWKNTSDDPLDPNYVSVGDNLSGQPVGTYYLKISGVPENGFQGDAYGAFEITKRPLTIDFTPVTATYGEDPKTVTYTIYDGETQLNPDAEADAAIIDGLGIQTVTKSGADEITITNTTGVGEYDFGFTYNETDDCDYTLTRKAEDNDKYVISAKSITADMVTMGTAGTYNYTGNAIEGLPTFTVMDGETDITSSCSVQWFADEATVDAADNTAVTPKDADTYYARIVGSGNYTGKVVKNDTWKIAVNRVPLTVLVNPKSKTYDGVAYTRAAVEYTFGGLVDADQGKVNLASLTPTKDGGVWVDFKDYKEGGYTIGVNVGAATIGAEPAIALNTNYTVTPVSSVWTINKITGLTITAANKVIDYGDDIPATSEITATGALEAEKATIEGYYTAPKAEGAKNDVYGTQVDIYTPALVDGEHPYLANYATPITIVKGSLSVGGQNATIMPIVASAVYDGKAHAATGYSANSGAYILTEWDGETGDIDVTNISYKYKKQNADLTWGEFTTDAPSAVGVYRAQVAKTSVSGKGSFADAEIARSEVQFEILAKPITVTVDDVTLHVGDTETTLNAHAKVTDAYKANLVSDETLEFTFKFDPAKVGADKVVKVEEGTGKISQGTGFGPENKAIIAELKDGAYNNNYKITFVPGDLIFGASELVLDPTDATLATKISEAAATGEKYDVTFDQLTMKANEWYAMVLPFDVDPKEMVIAADRYVIFNELNVAGTTAGNFKFTLKFDKIEAGTPFLIKFAGDADDIIDFGEMDDNGTPEDDTDDFKKISFNGVDISAAINATEKEGILTFTGTYASDVELQGSRTDGSENYVWWLCDTRYERSKRVNDWLKPISKPHAVKPMEAWLDANESAWTGYAPKITVEDFDGQTTSIKSLSVEQIHNMTVDGMYNLNGMKMNNVPTQKGIYIINGKKVVIK